MNHVKATILVVEVHTWRKFRIFVLNKNIHRLNCYLSTGKIVLTDENRPPGGNHSSR